MECREEIRIERYTPSMREQWDSFVGDSRNATFLFNRGYMDYHADRFEDCSLVAFHGNRILALLPANIECPEGGGKHLHSHQGLTYGGWLLPRRHSDAGAVLALFEALAVWCRAHDISALHYKPMPFIYPEVPSQEDLYALFRMGGVREKCLISAALPTAGSNSNGLKLNSQQKRNLKKSSGIDCLINHDTPVEEFYPLLKECLEERHGVLPVHSEEELSLLAGRFPGNIRIHTLESFGMQAGVCMFDTGSVAHCQYICSTPLAREKGLLTRLFVELIEGYYRDHAYFDFGTSNEKGGLVLNEGLYHQKAGFGATGVAYEQYVIYFQQGTHGE